MSGLLGRFGRSTGQSSEGGVDYGAPETSSAAADARQTLPTAALHRTSQWGTAELKDLRDEPIQPILERPNRGHSSAAQHNQHPLDLEQQQQQGEQPRRGSIASQQQQPESIAAQSVRSSQHGGGGGGSGSSNARRHTGRGHGSWKSLFRAGEKLLGKGADAAPEVMLVVLLLLLLPLLVLTLPLSRRSCSSGAPPPRWTTPTPRSSSGRR